MEDSKLTEFVSKFEEFTTEKDKKIITACYHIFKGNLARAIQSYIAGKMALLPQIEAYINKASTDPKSPPISSEALEKEIIQLTKWVASSINQVYNYIKQQLASNVTKSSQENCPICMCELYEGVYTIPEKERNYIEQTQIADKNNIPVVTMGNCTGHFFHKECLINAIKANNPDLSNLERLSYKCCVCGKVYGVLYGNQPLGKMAIKQYKVGELPLEGYENCGTYEIYYFFPSGTAGEIKYSGTQRSAYLPINDEGTEILEMLKIAFKRGHIFTVGTSVTSGKKNTVVWNGIHHKTATGGGTKYYGYPDPTYFSRVKEELAAKGVFVGDIKK
jgi:hypothetical protein